ncbi:outer membrane protein assembly factor BamE domain-containing protein [Alicycliphilus denitrificans]|uniref:Outer membrane protein assembly factor BamE n=1 Tax=Alicycliphilus denitrificans TaxID=179636 RepID=A0A3R7IS61_9BURK|nr:outer membrane protein assembly factor BamE [Alicycliphilus denitrificans]RKJ95485.1 outer membrane protein assembly factor BamE [Alicycliphilus denitrificans]
MKTIRPLSFPALVATALLLAGCVNVGHHNPVDQASNPNGLDFIDISARRSDFREPFLRDGVVTRPAGFRQITAGLTPEQVRQALGQPLQEQAGPRGKEWDYNFKFLIPQSANYLVCQYKVVFDTAGTAVRDTAWRRRQCQDLVASAR